jgi:hypothetical protein
VDWFSSLGLLAEIMPRVFRACQRSGASREGDTLTHSRGSFQSLLFCTHLPTEFREIPLALSQAAD